MRLPTDIQKYLIVCLGIISCTTEEAPDENQNLTSSEDQVFFIQPMQMTAGQDSNFSSDLSPDGKSIVYTSDRKGNLDLWMKKTSGGFNKPLTLNASDDRSPVISPDGKRVAFVSRRFDAGGDILVMKLGKSTSAEGKSLVVNHKEFEDSEPAWFPDGNKLIFASRKSGDRISSLMTVNLDDLLPKPLGEVKGTEAAIFPDGKRIVFVEKGRLKLYELDRHRSEYLTEEGIVQNGSPRISEDGKRIIFSRFLDDTNRDGLLNADDHPTIWIMNVENQNKTKNLENFLLMPLTSSRFAAWKPLEQRGKVYFSVQTGNGLNLFYLPSGGQTLPPVNVEEMERRLSVIEDLQDKIYYLRRSASHFARTRDYDSSLEASLLELRLYIADNRSLEARWLQKKIRNNFPDKKLFLMIADLVLIQGELGRSLKNPSAKAGERQPLKISANKIRNEAESGNFSRVVCFADLVIGHILKSEQQNSAASKHWTELGSYCTQHRKIAAEALLERARIQPFLGGQEAGIILAKEMLREFPEFPELVQKAAELSVILTIEGSRRPVADLHLLRQSSKNLPILPALAHLKIGEIFTHEDKAIVAANEYRVMISLYPDSPRVLLQASERLLQILLDLGRLDEATELMGVLYQQLKNQSPTYKLKARKMLVDVLGRQGERFLTSKDFERALEVYRRMEASDPGSYLAKKGLLRILSESEDRYGLTVPETVRNEPLSLFQRGFYLLTTLSLENSPSENLSILDESLELLEKSRDLDDQSSAIYQALGWAYQQKSWWLEQYELKGGLASVFGEGWNTIGLGAIADVIFDFRVLNFFGDDEPDWLELSIDSWLAALALSEPGSVERVQMNQNLAHAYYEKDLFKKSLQFFVKRIQSLSSVPIFSRESEALLWQRAARAAFQTDESELAIVFQTQSLNLWKKIGNTQQIYRSQDALALSLKNSGAYEEASEIYESLSDQDKTDVPGENKVKALINLSQCYSALNRKNAALEVLQESETILKETADQNPKHWGQLLVIETIRAEIWSEAGLSEPLQQSIRRKVSILEDIRRFGQEEEGKDEAWKALDLSYAYNQSGFLAMKRGLFEQARSDFSEAFKYSELIFPDKNKPAPPIWIANLVNMSKIQIKQISSGYMNPVQLRALDKLLERESLPWISQEKQPVKEGQEQANPATLTTTAPAYIPELLSAFGIVRSFVTQLDHDSNFQSGIGDSDPQNLLKSSMKIASLSAPGPEQYLEPWLALDLESRLTVSDKGSEYGNIARQVRQFSAGDKLLNWKYLMSARLWKDSLDHIEDYIRNQGYLIRHDDRMLIREAFENLLAQSGLKVFSEAFTLFQRYQKIRTWELFNRTFNSKDKNSALKPWQQQLISEKSIDTIQSSLEADEMLIAVHQIKLSKKTMILWISSENFGVNVAEGLLISGPGNSGEANQQVYSYLNQMVTDQNEQIKNLILIPSDESWDFEWKSLFADNLKLNLSYFPSIDSVPVLMGNRVGSGLVFVTDRKDLSQHLDQSLAPENHILLNASHEQTVPGHLSEVSHYYVTGAPLVLSRLDGSLSHWSQKDHTQGDTAYLDSSKLSQLDLHKNVMVLFTQARYIQDQKNKFDLPEHWLSLWYAIYGAGGRSLMLPWSSDVFEESLKMTVPKSMITQLHEDGAFSQSLIADSVNGRIIGPLRKTLEEDEREDAAEQAYESSEEFLEEGNVVDALKAQSEYLWLKSLSESTDDYLDGLGQYALMFYRRGDYLQALRIQNLINLIKSREDEEDSEIPGEGLMNAANFALLAKQYSEAGELLKAAERVYQEEEDFQTLGEIWRLKGIKADKEEKYSEAIEAYEMAKTRFQEEDLQTQVAAMLREIGVVYQIRINDFEKALRYFQMSIEILEEEEEFSALVKVLIEQANTYISMGQASRSLSIFNRALSYLSEEKSRSLYIRVLQGQGVALFRAGRLSRIPQVLAKLGNSIKRLPEASKIESRRKSGYLIDKINLEGMVFAKKGLWKEAFGAFDTGLTMARDNGFKSKEAFLLNNYGFWMRESGHSQKSLAYFERAYKIDSDRNIKKDIAYDLRNMGLSEVSLGHLESAQDHLTESLAISKKIGILYNLIYCHMGLGDLYRKQKSFAKAKGHYRSAADLAARSGLEDFMWKAVAAQGLLALDQGEVQEARSKFEQSVSLIESFNPGLQSRSSVSGLSSELGVQDIYDHLVALYGNEEDHLQALEYSERSKMRQVIDAIGHLDLPLSDHQARERISNLKNDLVTLQLLNTKRKKLTGDKKNQAESEYGRLKSNISKVMSALKSDSPKAWSLFRVQNLNLNRVQSGLQEGSSILNYHMGRHNLFIWVISKQQIEFRKIGIPRDEIEQALSDYQLIIENYSSVEHLSRQLYDILVRPVRDLIAESKRVGIVSHRRLAQLSFASLKEGDSWLVDEHELYYLELVSDQIIIPDRQFPWSGSQSSILALVNPDRTGFEDLPFAEKEADAIRFAFEKTKILSGKNAHADAFLTTRTGLDILHLGVHGSFDRSDPAQSSLYFSPDGNQNGEVRASGLFTYQHFPYLVVLSACESGRTDAYDGEPFVSLSRAFFYGGTKSLLSSLWRIDDVSSAMIMKRFYRNMASGDTLGQALQKSQNTVRKYFPHPVFWAAFKLNGSYH